MYRSAPALLVFIEQNRLPRRDIGKVECPREHRWAFVRLHSQSMLNPAWPVLLPLFLYVHMSLNQEMLIRSILQTSKTETCHCCQLSDVSRVELRQYVSAPGMRPSRMYEVCWNVDSTSGDRAGTKSDGAACPTDYKAAKQRAVLRFLGQSNGSVSRLTAVVNSLGMTSCQNSNSQPP